MNFSGSDLPGDIWNVAIAPGFFPRPSFGGGSGERQNWSSVDTQQRVRLTESDCARCALLLCGGEIDLRIPREKAQPDDESQAHAAGQLAGFFSECQSSEHFRAQVNSALSITAASATANATNLALMTDFSGNKLEYCRETLLRKPVVVSLIDGG